MATFRLTPTKTDHPFWDGSDHREEVLVRAPSERIARSAAGLVFGVAVTAKLGNDTPLSPWKDASLASCEIVDPDDEGAVEIIEPVGDYESLEHVVWEA